MSGKTSFFLDSAGAFPSKVFFDVVAVEKTSRLRSIIDRLKSKEQVE